MFLSTSRMNIYAAALLRIKNLALFLRERGNPFGVLLELSHFKSCILKPPAADLKTA